MIDTKTEGAITMFASMSAGVVNVPQAQAPYNASKAAVRHLGASMAVELATKGVRVNCLSPGYILTSLTKTILDKDTQLRDTWVSLTRPSSRRGST
jgi:NAD(P)-dependent dehydrogenase (short-subunit alcohol dehydrogenase family)